MLSGIICRWLLGPQRMNLYLNFTSNLIYKWAWMIISVNVQFFALIFSRILCCERLVAINSNILFATVALQRTRSFGFAQWLFSFFRELRLAIDLIVCVHLINLNQLVFFAVNFDWIRLLRLYISNRCAFYQVFWYWKVHLASIVVYHHLDRCIFVLIIMESTSKNVRNELFWTFWFTNIYTTRWTCALVLRGAQLFFNITLISCILFS